MFKLTLRVLFFIFVCAYSMAAEYTRSVEFEWDEIVGATSYDIEFKSTSNNVQLFKVKSAKWQGDLAPGKYKMRMRSRDHRKVPGNWSPESELVVGLELPKINGPNNSIDAKSDIENVEFTWSAVPMAKKYTVEIKTEDGVIAHLEETLTNKVSCKLASAKKYTWSVQAHLDETVSSERTAKQDFTLIGTPLPEVKITKPISEFVRNVEWTPSGELYIVTLKKWDSDQKNWKDFKKFQLKKPSFEFGKNWPGGKYKLQVQSKTPLRPMSPQVDMEFDVKSGIRSPAAERMILMKRAITRSSNWYMQSGFLVNTLAYTSISNMMNSRAVYEVSGALTRITLGHEKPWAKWGFNMQYEMASYFLNNLSNFNTLELNSTYKYYSGPKVDVRFIFGGYYRETPESYSIAGSTDLKDTQSTRIGAHLAADIRYSFNHRWGVQTGLHIYQPLSTLNSPFGTGSESPMALEFGIWGLYRVNEKMTTSFGFSTKEEIFHYPKNLDISGSVDSGQKDQSILNNSAFGLSAEWSF